MYLEINEVHKEIIVEALSYMRNDLAGLAACIADDPELERLGLLDTLMGKQVLISRALHALHCDHGRREVGHGIF